MDKLKDIKAKVEILNKAAKAYYVEDKEIISNFEYDELYDELLALEKETGIVLSNSPTQNVGYETLSELPKEAHPSKMLSLDKTKSVEDLISWSNGHESLLSWKLDGLTVVLTYEDGKLIKAVTRGSGEIGEVITNNAKVFVNLPVTIPAKEKIVIRGEAIITYSDFDRINRDIPDIDAKYKNPRNLCSGSVRQLNNQVTAGRSVRFVAFSMTGDAFETRKEQLDFLEKQGFEVVEYKKVTDKNLSDAIKEFASSIDGYDYPSDGLVLNFNNIAYGKSLGETSKFPRDAIAFKWKDEIKETKLLEIEWSPSRTGLINPIAIFEPVELEGTTVTRASVHNISILKELELGVGDTIAVYKANMIIPQISDNLTRSSNVEIPKECPVCGGDTKVKNDNGVDVLYCTNENCPAKFTKAFALFASRDAMNIEGISESTIQKLTEIGALKEAADFFKLEEHRENIESMEGFGQKSYYNLIGNVNKARTTTAGRLLYSLGIQGIGVVNAKLIAKNSSNDFKDIINLSEEELVAMDGIGPIMAKNFVDFFRKEENLKKVDNLLKEVIFAEEKNVSNDLDKMVFVITGSLNTYENRGTLKKEIEQRGGKVSSSVSSKTSYLINNDIQSSSSKNKDAKKLGVEIITEEDFINRFGN